MIQHRRLGTENCLPRRLTAPQRFFSQRSAVLLALFVGATASSLLSAPTTPPPPTLVFRGRIGIAGAPFEGRGQFADLWIVKGQPLPHSTIGNARRWPERGSQQTITGGISETVQQGKYTLRLAPPSEALAAFSSASSNPNDPSPVVLQIWFNDGFRGWWPIATSAVPAFAQSPVSLPPSELASGNSSPSTSRSTSAPSTLGDRVPSPGLRRLDRPPEFARERITASPTDLGRDSERKFTNATHPQPGETGLGQWPLPDGPLVGNPQTPLALVAFLDVDCIHCRRWLASVYPRLEEHWIRTGKLRVIFQLRPPSGRAGSEAEAQALLCAQLQGQFLPALRARMSGSLKDSNPVAWKRLDPDLRLDSDAWQRCVESMQTFPNLQQHLRAGLAANVHATPTFFLGRTEGVHLKGFRLDGNQSVAEFERRMTLLLEDLPKNLPRPTPR